MEEKEMIEMKKMKRVARKPEITNHVQKFKSQNILEAHYNAIGDPEEQKKSIYDSPRSSLNRVQKMNGRKSSPGDVNRSNIFKNKMKKVVPKMKKKSSKMNQDLSWFDADSEFGIIG